jgi:hypothetical protein
LNKREQKQLVGLIYKAEMMETYMRDRQIVRINDSFEDIVESVARMLDEVDERDRRDRDEDDEDFR